MDDFDIGPQIDESFSWYDYEMFFGDLIAAEEEEDYDDQKHFHVTG